MGRWIVEVGAPVRIADRGATPPAKVLILLKAIPTVWGGDSDEVRQSAAHRRVRLAGYEVSDRAYPSPQSENLLGCALPYFLSKRLS